MEQEAINLYASHQIRDCERIAYANLRLSESELMERAGSSAFKSMKVLFPKAQKIIIYCGSGSNAGDGYVLARLANLAGLSVMINQFKAPDLLPPTAKDKAYEAIEAGIPIQAMEEIFEIEADLIVDALLGTGLHGPVKEPLLTAINQINDSGLPVFSLDLPSGLDADTGRVHGAAVRATATLTFIGHKQGLYTLDGPDHCGKILCNALNLESCLSQLPPTAMTLSPPNLAPRPKSCHKGDFGQVLIIGGNEGMPGSVSLAASAALRVGAGSVIVGTKSAHAARATFAPEVMVYGLEGARDLEPLLKKASICLIGPGLGMDGWALELFLKVIASPLPMVIDAEALRLLALYPQRDDNWVLTPHPGEAATLLDSTTQIIQQDRFKSVLALQQQYGGNIVLKGLGSLVQTDEPKTYLCTEGSPGMASAGMGDVLSGVIAGLAAQHLRLSSAACLGVYIHAKAGRLAAEDEGERGLLASDLLPYLRRLVNV